MRKLIIAAALVVCPLIASAQAIPSINQLITPVTSGFVYSNGNPISKLVASSSPFFSTFTFGTATGTAATTTSFFSTTASTTNLFGTFINGFGLSTCNGTNALTWTGGSFTCTAQPQGTVTAVTATWPIISSGGTTPNITWGGLSTSTALTSGQVDFSTGVNTIGNDGGFLWDNTLKKLTATNASTTALTATNAYLTNLSNLVSNGFVKTSGSNGALSIDTNTYLTSQNYKEAAKYATTAALPTVVYSNGASGVGATITAVGVGALSLDGNTPSVNDRVLVKNQASTFQNGIYNVTTVGSVGAVFVLTRATDADQSAEWSTGDAVFVTSGTAQSATTWAYTGVDSPTIGTDAITFSQIAGPGSFTAGNGISISGTTISQDFSFGGTYTGANIFNNITRSTTTNATTTNLFSTTASSTNLFSTNSNLGVVTSGLINGQTISSAANFTGSLTMNGAFANTGSSNSYFTGNVGIGTTTPLARLDVAGTLGSQSDLFNVSSTTATNVVSTLFRIKASGNVGIGTTNPQQKLSVNYNTSNAFPGISVSDTAVNASTGLTVNNTDTTTTGTPSSSGILFNMNNNNKGRIKVDNNGLMTIAGSGFGNDLTINSSGNVGIGTASPNIESNGGGALTLTGTGTNSKKALEFQNATPTTASSLGSIGWFSNTTPVAYIDVVTDGNTDAGAIALGTQPHSGSLTERLKISSAGALRFEAYGAGTLTTDASGNVTASSDERLKNIQGSFDAGLQEILGLNPIIYKWNDLSGLDQTASYAGFSAQNVQQFIPLAVGLDSRGYLTLSDRPIEAALVNSVKELNQKVEDQQKEIDALKAAVTKLQK